MPTVDATTPPKVPACAILGNLSFMILLIPLLVLMMPVPTLPLLMISIKDLAVSIYLLIFVFLPNTSDKEVTALLISFISLAPLKALYKF